MSNLRSTVTKDASGRLTLVLSGAIDEHSDLPAAFRCPAGDVVLVLEGIERINSIGVHRWIPVFQAFASGRRVEVERLSYPLVLQANMVTNLFDRVKVVSCLAPYLCPSCRQNRVAIIRGEELGPTREPPVKNCAVCGTAMVFDELDTYFAFFETQ